MDVARDGPRDAPPLLVVSSACHGVEGFCGSGVQVALLGDAAWHAGRARRRRRRALRPRPQPLRLFLVAADDARERRPEPQLPRLRAPSCPRNRGLRRARRADRAARPGRRTRPTSRELERFVAEHGATALQQADLRRPVPPSATASSSAAPRRPGATRRCARCCASTARAAAGSAGSTCTPASGRAATASASSPAATTPRRRPRPAWWGDVTSIYDGSSTSALLTGLMWQRRLRGVPAGRVHRHRARVRHPAAGRRDGRAARRPVAARTIPRPTKRPRRAIKQQVRDAFYTDTDAWKEQIVEQAVDAAYGAVRGLAEHRD